MIVRKGLVALLSVLFSLSLVLAACSSDTKNGSSETPVKPGSSEASQGTAQGELKLNPPGKFPIVEENMTLGAFTHWESYMGDAQTTEFTKSFEKLTNVTLKMDMALQEAFAEKKQLLFASGDYPEMILSGKLTPAEQLKYGQQGVLLPLNDLIDRYAPNVKKAMEDFPYLKEAMIAPDGNIYAIPQINECFHCSLSQKLWINKTWLDALALPMPETTEEYYEVLKAFKERDPNGNGKPDEVPLSGATPTNVWNGNFETFLMNAFIYVDWERYLFVKDGQVEFAPNKPEWKQGLEYVHKLYSEGLIDEGAFTQNGEALTQLDGQNLLGGFTAGLITYATGELDDKDYVTLPPLKGPNGVQLTTFFGGIKDSAFAITNKATPLQQAVAMRIADYLYSEEAIVLSEKGLEGVHWRKAVDGEKGLDGKPAKYAVITEAEAKENNIAIDPDMKVGWLNEGPSLRSAEYRASWATSQDMYDPTGAGYELRLWNESKKYEPYKPKEVLPSSLFMEQEDAEQLAQIQMAITDYVRQNLAQFITGNKALDEDWDAYVAGFDGLQLNRYIEIYQNAYKK